MGKWNDPTAEKIRHQPGKPCECGGCSNETYMSDEQKMERAIQMAKYQDRAKRKNLIVLQYSVPLYVHVAIEEDEWGTKPGTVVWSGISLVDMPDLEKDEPDCYAYGNDAIDPEGDITLGSPDAVEVAFARKMGQADVVNWPANVDIHG